MLGSSYVQGLFPKIHNWYLTTNYGDMPIRLPYPTLGIKCSRETLEGSGKPQPGCKRKADWAGESICMVGISYPWRFIWIVFAHFWSFPPGPGPYYSCPSLCLESSLPTCFSWLTSILVSKEVAPTILPCPELYGICSVIDCLQTTFFPFRALISICETARLFKARLCQGLKASSR